MTSGVLPADTRVGRIALQVANLERSIAFYRDVIGFRVHWTDGHGDGRLCMLGMDGRPDHLLQLCEKPGVRPVSPRGQIGLYHFAILLPERTDLGRFIVHAANSRTPLAAADHLFSEATYLTDPDGIQVEVYRDRPQSEWTYRDGELVGDTLALDFDSVVGSAAGTTWQGLPAGTTMGHVHLYVRDLAQARAFYVAALGFTPTITSYPGALFVAAGSYHHHVGLNTWAAAAPQATSDDARLLAWELVLPDRADRDAAADRLRGAGYAVETRDDACVARDPWDITVRLTAGR